MAGGAGQGRARLGAAWQGRAWQGRQGRAGRGVAGPGMAGQAGRGRAGQGAAGLGRAWQAWHGRRGWARQGTAGRGGAGQGRAGMAWKRSGVMHMSNQEIAQKRQRLKERQRNPYSVLMDRKPPPGELYLAVVESEEDAESVKVRLRPPTFGTLTATYHEGELVKVDLGSGEKL